MGMERMEIYSIWIMENFINLDNGVDCIYHKDVYISNL
jgi:hypothetical protein